MRACATHPWRVVLSWLGILALLIVLVGTVGGSLKDEFEIPGSDTQRATDLIEAEFASEQGAVLNLVFAAPEGERLDTPERKAAIEAAIAKLKTRGVPATEDSGRASRAWATRSSADTVLRRWTHRLCGGTVLRDHREEDREQVVAVEDAVREAVEPAGVTAEFNGDAEFPPIEQGTQELLGLLDGTHRAAHRLPNARRDLDPDRPCDHRADDVHSFCCSYSRA